MSELTDVSDSNAAADPFASLRRHVSPAEIPGSADLLTAAQLGQRLEQRYSLLLVGDVLLGDRAAGRIDQFGADYPFASMLPLLRKSEISIANLEAPFATSAAIATGRFSYRVDPALVECLKRAGMSAVNLANNHILDCGREGVLETIETLSRAGIAFFGAGGNERLARRPLVLQSGQHRIGFLGYYWNAKYCATAELPGTAISDPVLFEPTIRELRSQVDTVIVSFHWGDTYAREPSAKARHKARLAIDAGADMVVGHHPHIVQPMEIHRGRPIFYSIGNFSMGSGNSRAEGLALAIRLGPREFVVDVYALYVKNRDPRVNYQTRVLAGDSATRVFNLLRAPALASRGITAEQCTAIFRRFAFERNA